MFARQLRGTQTFLLMHDTIHISYTLPTEISSTLVLSHNNDELNNLTFNYSDLSSAQPNFLILIISRVSDDNLRLTLNAGKAASEIVAMNKTQDVAKIGSLIHELIDVVASALPDISQPQHSVNSKRILQKFALMVDDVSNLPALKNHQPNEYAEYLLVNIIRLLEMEMMQYKSVVEKNVDRQIQDTTVSTMRP